MALLLLLTGLAAHLFFRRLGAADLRGDEAIHAVVAREAAGRDPASAPWWALTYDGNPYTSKPPAKLLAEAWIFRRFGASELHARVLDAAFGVATVALALLFGARVWNLRVGAAAALLLVGAPHYVLDHGVRSGVQDSALVFLIAAWLVLYFEARESEARRGPLLAGAAVAAALAWLVKGPAAAPAFVLLVAYELARRHLAGDGGRHARAPLLVSLAGPVAYLAWFLAVLRRVGGSAARTLFDDVVVRATEGLDPSHLHGPSYYLRTLGTDFGLWWLAALPALALLAWAWVRGRRARGADLDLRGLAFVALWGAGWVAIFTLSSSKRAWYLYPAYPAFALLLGRGLDEVVRRSLGLLRVGRVPLAALVVAVAMAAGLAVRAQHMDEQLAAQRPPQVPARRLARAFAQLPHPWVLRRPKAGLAAWDLYYLGPFLGERRYRIPKAFRDPAAGTCRFLVQDTPWPPGSVEAKPRPPAIALGFAQGDDAWILDLDHCLPPWV